MRTLLLISFLLFSYHSFADLRQAFNDFEDATRLKLRISENTKRANAMTNEQVKIKEVTLKSIELDKQKSAEKYQQSADEFAKFRLQGATIPIAYLEYMARENLAKISIDIRWDETRLIQIETTRNKERGNFAIDPIKNNHPLPRIPVKLMKESQESLITSIFAAGIGQANTTKINKERILSLWNHFETSESFNCRALFHLCKLIETTKKEIQWEKKDNKNFWELIEAWNKGSTALNNYYFDYKERKKSATIASFQDPDFLLFYAKSLMDKCTTGKYKNTAVSAVYNANLKGDPKILSENHTLCGIRDFTDTKKLDFYEFMTAFQQGCVVLNHTFKFGCLYNSLIALDYILIDERITPDEAAYFGFIGFEKFGSEFCASNFEQLAAPFCSAYRPQFNQEHPFDPTVNSAEAYFRYKKFSQLDNEKSMAYLKIAADNGEPAAQYENAKMQLRFNPDRAEQEKALKQLKAIATKKNNHEMRYPACALIANLYLMYGHGDPHTSYEYARTALNNWKDEDFIGDKPTYGLLAYYIHHGIGCKKDVAEAERIAKKDKHPSLWTESRSLTEHLNNLFHNDDDISNINLAITNLIIKYFNASTTSDYLPNFSFLTDKLYEWVSTLDTHTEKGKSIACAIFDQIFRSCDFPGRKKFSLYAAQIVKNQPHVVTKLINEVDIYGYNNGTDGNRILSAQEYLEKAIKANVPDAFMMKANCILNKEIGYGGGDRKTELVEALKLCQDHHRHNNLEDQITRRLILNELATLNHVPDTKYEIEVDEDSEESDETNDSIALVTTSSTSACCSNSITATPQTPANLSDSTEAREECNNIIADAKRQSNLKKDRLTLEHSMTLPKNYNNSAKEKTKKTFNVSRETQAFVGMVFGFGEKRIHHYDVDAAAACFKNLGFTVTSKDQANWEYEDTDGILHKLSFHIPHGRCENKLYPAIRTRIKHFFERIGVTPELVTISKTSS